MDFIANEVYVTILSIIAIAGGVVMKHFWPHIKDRSIKLPLIKRPINTFKFSYLCIGIALALFEIAKFGVWGSMGATDPAVYIAVFISSYFMYFFIVYGFTKKTSFCNSTVSVGIYISTIVLWVFMYAIPGTMHNSVAIILWRHDELDFFVWHTFIYHTVGVVAGIIFLIINPYKINAWRDCLKGLIPLGILTTIAYFCATFIPMGIDAFTDYDWNVITKGVYDGVGQVIALYNLVVYVIQIALFVMCYYSYYIASVLIPRLIKYLSSNCKKSRTLSK